MSLSKIEIEDKVEESEIASPASLFVSLYLVILAFFIMLNSISKIDGANSDQAMGSVRKSFSSFADIDIKLPFIELPSPAGADLAVNNYFAPVGKIARESVTLVNAKIVERGNSMEMTVPISSFFPDGEFYIKPEQNDFMEKLAKEVIKLEDGAKIDLEVLVGSELLKDYPTVLNNLPLARMGIFARTLINLGVRESSIFAGVVPGGNTEDMVMIFHLRSIKESEVSPEIKEEKKDVDVQ